MEDYTKPLNNEGWSEHYNLSSLEKVINNIKNAEVSIWTKELCNIIPENASCLEIGCGTGMSSLWLAKHNRKVTSLDYTETSIALVNMAAERLNITLKIIQSDATKELPFKKKEFDAIFQCGLLEHFSTDQQIELLRNWKRYCGRMISMIPNAASIPYRIGKEMMEASKTWGYGMEIPKHSLAKEFVLAGIEVEQEYTIGTEWALKFLPKHHYLRRTFNKLERAGMNLDDMMQGYLLVTIGKCMD